MTTFLRVLVDEMNNNRNTNTTTQQRSSLKQHITARGGYWPPDNSEMFAKYLLRKCLFTIHQIYRL